MQIYIKEKKWSPMKCIVYDKIRSAESRSIIWYLEYIVSTAEWRPLWTDLSFELITDVDEDEARDLDQGDNEGALGHGAQVVTDQTKH